MTRPLLLLALATLAASAHATQWSADPAASTLTFQAKYEDEPFDGKFARFTPTIAFDGKDPATIRIAVDVDVASVDTANEERDGTLRTPDFFWFDKYPNARFETTSCRAGAAPNRYVCAATLTIRDKTKTLDFPFEWTAAADGTAALTATVTLDRTDYDVGHGDWADDALIAHAVEVRTKVQLKPGK